MAQTVSDRCNPDGAVLMVVDVQNDFCDPAGVMARRGRDVSMAAAMASRLAAVIRAARVSSVPVVFVRTTHSEQLDSEAWRWRTGIAEEGYVCLEGSWGAEYFGVEPEPGDVVVTKHRYSAFGAEGLPEALRAIGRQSLLFTGVATNVCVETSLRDAVCADYLATLVEDCCAAYSPVAHATTITNVETNFGTVVTSESLLECWSR